MLYSCIAHASEGDTLNLQDFSASAAIHYSVKDGLPSVETYDVFEDSQGFIWVCTDRGIVRYNGYEFERINTEEGVNVNTFFWATEDEHNTLWFMSRTKELFYFKDNALHPYKFNKTLKDYLEAISRITFVTDLYVDDKDVFIRYDRDTSTIKIDKLGNFEYVDQSYWNSIYTYADQKKIRVSRYREMVDRMGYISQNRSKLNWRNHVYHIPYNDSLDFRISPYNATLKNRYSGKTVKKLIEGFWLTGATADSDRGIWLSTLSYGVFYIPNSEIEILYEVDLGSERIVSITNSTTDTIWFTVHQGGVWHYMDMKNKKVFKYPERGIKVSTASTFIDYLPYQTSIIHIRDKQRRTNQFFQLGEQEFFLMNPIGGIAEILEMTDSCTMIYSINTLTDYSTACFTQQRELLLANIGGLYEIRNREQVVKISSDSLFRYRIEDFKQLDDSLFVLSTKGNGLLLYNRKSVKLYTTKDGLLSDVLAHIYVLGNSSFLLASDKGIQHVVLKNDELQFKKVISKNDGLSNTNVHNVFVRDKFFYFATDNAIVRYPVSKFHEEREKPTVFIDQIKLGGKAQDVDNPIEVDYLDDNLEVKLTSLSYRSFGTQTYYYRILEEDKNWNTTENRTFRYNALAPGDYTLLVKVKSKDDVFSDEKVIQFSIQPAIWMTLWFKMSTIVLLIAVVAYFFYWLYRNRLKNIEQQQQLTAFHQQSLKLQMNPHFIFNTLNTIQLSITKLDQMKAYQLLTNFSRLIRYTLKTSTVAKISLREELDYISNYVDLEREKLEHGVDFEIDVDGTIDVEAIEIPPMLIQPLVENAIWHGVNPLKEKGSICLNVMQEMDKLHFQIIDNGVGKEMSKEKNGVDDIPSIALRNIYERFRLLERAEGKKYKLTIHSIYDSEVVCGTKAEVIIPIAHPKKEKP